MDPIESIEFREGYGEGLSEGVAMFRRAGEELQRRGGMYTADDFMVLVEVAERNAEEWRSRATNI